MEWSERGRGGGKKAGRLGGEGEDDGAAHAARQTKNDEPRWGPDGGQKHATGPKPRPLLCRLPCYVYRPRCVSARSGCTLSNGGQRCRSHAHRDRNRFRRVSNVVDLEGEELYVVYSRFGNCNSVILVKGKFVRLERILDSIY